jgi:branched-chain amino acid transport system permease protein
VIANLAAQFINGLTSGAIYGLVALGLALIYGVLRKLHFAHGEVYMIGAYAILVPALLFRLPYVAAIPVAVVTCALLGVLIERLVFRPLLNAPELNTLVAALGTSVFLQYLVAVVLQPGPRNVVSPFTDRLISLGFVTTSYQKALIVITVAALAWGTHLLLTRTRFGKAIRAITQDRVAAQSLGIDVQRLVILTFALGSAMAGLGGALVGPISYVDPFVGSAIILKAFIVVLLGGYGSITGTMLAALLVGMLEAFSITFLSVSFQDLVTFSVIIGLLLLRPSGLFGRAEAGLERT